MKKGPFSGSMPIWKYGHQWVQGTPQADSNVVEKEDPATQPFLRRSPGTSEFGTWQGNDADLTPWILTHISDDFEWYTPLKIHDLHRQFASLNPSEESILSFANAYGLLGCGQTITLESGETCFAESLQAWADLRTDWIETIELWDLYQAGRRDSEVQFKRRAAKAGLTLHRADDWDDYPRLALQIVAWHLEDELEHFTRPRIDVETFPKLALEPLGLRGSIAAVMLLELTGAAPLRRVCPGCGRGFVPKDERQIYHEDKCRFRAYRKRRGTVSGGQQ